MKKRNGRALILCLSVVLLAAVAAFASANYGTQEDPLISKSYLDEVIQPQLIQMVESQLEASMPEERRVSGIFELVTLDSGQRLVGSVGTEMLLRSGSAQGFSYDRNDVALVDTTSAASVLNGAVIAANHLYLISIQGNGITVSSNGTTLLVSGDYTVE